MQIGREQRVARPGHHQQAGLGGRGQGDAGDHALGVRGGGGGGAVGDGDLGQAQGAQGGGGLGRALESAAGQGLGLGAVADQQVERAQQARQPLGPRRRGGKEALRLLKKSDGAG